MSPPKISHPLDPDQIRAAGEYLYGERWVTPMAAELYVTVQAVRSWINAKNPRQPVGPTTTALGLLVARKAETEELFD